MKASTAPLAAWHIEPLNPAEAPWPLLLSADPSREKVRGYLAGSTCFAARESFQREGQPPRPGGRGEVLGLCVLVALRASVEDGSPPAWELMNIAVTETLHNRGLGTALLRRAIEWARSQGAPRLEVGTGTFGDQLVFYQRAGFRVTGIKRDFFLKHYTTQLWERGVQHRDMLRLTLNFPSNSSGG
ncbi:GNAT family N-acetyltransferase [Delftia sp. PS-11]|uniref:GNAT family N-acetyltransferase n=1 Tax=Delftia sp. PS-11 TaxID=2767222 RepID=UPI002458DBCB|nr:GNAT family N-acetyltransferase [Delftia sp. PS-11]KAJ8743112.1 GNAT family N-acetyltransferase [Delftia sp. PS-11]